jgi:glycine cleavage system H protein
MNDRRYARTDEWLQIDGAYALVGISDHAQDSLSDIVYVRVAERRRQVRRRPGVWRRRVG